MTGEHGIRETLELYKKHGWNLRRVLLSDETRSELGEPAAVLFVDAEIVDSDIDAAWFSRRTRDGQVAWELRALSGAPVALLEVVGMDSSLSDVDGMQSRLEAEMRRRTRA